MLRVLSTVAAAAIIVTACGGAASPAPAASTAAPTAGAKLVAMDVQGFKFAQASLEVPAGTTVTWTNKDTAGHTVTSGKPDAKDGKFDGALDPSGGTFAFTFKAAGTYEYFCMRHPKTMLATIVVK